MNQPLPRYVDYMYSYPHKTAYRSFPSPVSLVPYLKQVEGQKASLYFHIPFCSHKCGYCNLFSLQTNRADYIATYLETLHKQAQQLSPLTTGLAFDSFAIGGGTPLLLTVPQLEYLLDTAALFGVHPSYLYFRRNIAEICRSYPFGLVEASRSSSCEYWRTEFP